ncbi:hypothetical protein LJR225_003449 [Phenylobacterium sp. LjRoot225]|uniref:hypothetical protein n=1 Tax=Phenylobacterium sp. LjRoot225 TaxID=3342285 RepID=UPI003ECEE9E7
MSVNTKIVWLAVALALTACNRQPAQAPSADAQPAAHVAPPSVDVTRLAADRAALDDAHARCKAREADATPELCAAAAEATRRRFTGSAPAYAPTPVDAFPSQPR